MNAANPGSSWHEYLRKALLRADVIDRIRKATTAGRLCALADIAKQLMQELQQLDEHQAEKGKTGTL